jgi:hypothetical protein
MSAQRELIAAALSAADKLRWIERYRVQRDDLREACARAMVQPAAPDIAEVERLVHAYADAKVVRYGLLAELPHMADPEQACTALLDAVRGVLAERDQFRDAAKMVLGFSDTARAALLWVLWYHQGGSSPVGQPIRFALGIGQHDHLSDEQVSDAKRWGELHGIGSAAPQPVGEVPMPEPEGKTWDYDRHGEGCFFPTDDFTRDQMRTYGDAREAAGYAAGVAAGGELTAAARSVLGERQRQISQEGWTPEHDDEHSTEEMAFAAACYCTADEDEAPPAIWPWDVSCWKPTGRRRNLVKAAALLLAEIERLDRAALRGEVE